MRGDIVRLSKILDEETAGSEGKMVIRTVPAGRQPSPDTISRLERKIRAQMQANDYICERSMAEGKRLLLDFATEFRYNF